MCGRIQSRPSILTLYNDNHDFNIGGASLSSFTGLCLFFPNLSMIISSKAHLKDVIEDFVILNQVCFG